MAEKMNNVEIPEYIVLSQDKETFKERYDHARSGIANAYEQLKSITDIAEVIPADVKEVKAELVNTYIDARISEIAGMKMLTSEARERAKSEWEDIRKNALSHVGIIQRFFTNYPTTKFVRIGEKLVCVNSDEVVFDSCKRRVPKEDVMKHYELIQNVSIAIDALWAFEREHDWPSDNLLNLENDLKQIENPEQLATNWVFRECQREYIKQHPYLDGAYNVARRSTLAEQNARLVELRKKHLEEHPEDFVALGNKSNPYENTGTVKMK